MQAPADGLLHSLKSPLSPVLALQEVQLLLPDYLENLHSLWASWLSAPIPSPGGDSRLLFNGAPLTAAVADMLSSGQLSIKDHKLKALQLRLAVQQVSRQVLTKCNGVCTSRLSSSEKIEVG